MVPDDLTQVFDSVNIAHGVWFACVLLLLAGTSLTIGRRLKRPDLVSVKLPITAAYFFVIVLVTPTFLEAVRSPSAWCQSGKCER